MAGKHGVHRNPFLGWNPPAEDSAWVRGEAEHCGVALSTLLNEALADLRAKRSAKHLAPPAPAVFVAAENDQPQQAPRNCKHRNMRMAKGVCPDCQQWVTGR